MSGAQGACRYCFVHTQNSTNKDQSNHSLIAYRTTILCRGSEAHRSKFLWLDIQLTMPKAAKKSTKKAAKKPKATKKAAKKTTKKAKKASPKK